MRTNIKRIDMLKILLLAKFKESKFCYIIILRVAKQLIQLNNNYRYSDNSGSDTTMFLPEQLVTINEEQIIQTAGMIVSTDAIKKVDAMLVRQLQIGEYDG